MTDANVTPETDEPAAQADELPVDEIPVEADVPANAVEPLPSADEVFDSMPATAAPENYDSIQEYVYEASVSAPADDWMMGDIDAALAAVATLSEIMPEREAEAEARADARQSAPTFIPEMKMPPLTTLKRGQLGSIIPALLLIGLGAWLTVTTTSGAPPDALLVAALVVGGIAVSLLAQWLGSGRWLRGALFLALVVLLVAGVGFFSVQPAGIDLQRGYPLLLVAVGLAAALSGLLARPVNARLLAPGALAVLAGLVGLVVTLGFVPDTLMTAAVPLAPVVLGIVVILWLLPLIFRRR